MTESASTCLVGLIGKGIRASKSPSMHESEAAAHGLNLVYELIDLEERSPGVEALPALLLEAEQRGFAGVNITYPCKQAVIPLLTELSDEAAAIGAVNTVQFIEGRRIGYNTDAWGFAQSMLLGLPGAARDSVLQIGAGGAGAATAYAMLTSDTRQLFIHDADTERALALQESLAKHFPASRIDVAEDLRSIIPQVDGLVHATPMGMAKHPGSAVPAEFLRADLWVAEIVYYPLETELLRLARAAGCQTLDGGGMAVFQAARAFEIFTGRKAHGERMRNHFLSLEQN